MDSRIQRGIDMEKEGSFEEGLACFNKAVEMNPQNNQAWYHKTLLDDDLRTRREAIHSYQRFLELSPPQNTQQIDFLHRRLKEMGVR